MEPTTAGTWTTNQAEWNALIGRYLPQLKQFAQAHLPAYLRGTITADDRVQEVVLSGIRQLHRLEFRHEHAFLSYLLTSIRHRIVDEIRRTRRQPALVKVGNWNVDPSVSTRLQCLKASIHTGCLSIRLRVSARRDQRYRALARHAASDAKALTLTSFNAARRVAGRIRRHGATSMPERTGSIPLGYLGTSVAAARLWKSRERRRFSGRSNGLGRDTGTRFRGPSPRTRHRRRASAEAIEPRHQRRCSPLDFCVPTPLP